MPRPVKQLTPTDMFTAARLFYDADKSRKEIAGELRTDIRGVTKLLKEARKQGIVRIHIFETVASNIEQGIHARFPKLEKVLIIPGPEINAEAQCDDLFRRMGVLAADYFDELLERHPSGKPFHIGVTGGARLLEFAAAVPVRNRESVRVHVTALVGRGQLGESASHVEPNVAASILWTHCGSYPGHCEYETVAPYRTGDSIPSELKRLEKVPSIKAIVRDMDRLDAVFAGFGSLNTPTPVQASENRITMGSLLKSHVEPEELSGAVGDFCYCPFDADGNSDERWRFFLTAGHYSKNRGIEFYKRMVANGKKVVGFGGPHLLPVIKAALKSSIINVLLIDEHSARKLAEGS